MTPTRESRAPPARREGIDHLSPCADRLSICTCFARMPELAVKRPLHQALARCLGGVVVARRRLRTLGWWPCAGPAIDALGTAFTVLPDYEVEKVPTPPGVMRQSPVNGNRHRDSAPVSIRLSSGPRRAWSGHGGTDRRSGHADRDGGDRSAFGKQPLVFERIRSDS